MLYIIYIYIYLIYYYIYIRSLPIICSFIKFSPAIKVIVAALSTEIQMFSALCDTRKIFCCSTLL